MKRTLTNPLHRFTARVRQDWLDYNGHMNVAYYTQVFDQAGDSWVTAAGMGEAYTRETGNSWMILETHTTFQHEAVAEDLLVVSSQILALDNKRVHLFQIMENDEGQRLSSNEEIILHVDLRQRRATPFPPQVMNRLRILYQQQAEQEWPPEAGRSVAMGARRPVKRPAGGDTD
ncbi:MAG: thioesterase family protein [Gammaproteobacteria bacterium]|nr:thioesterase family protein [Gammaproteobacteria bacterium]